MTDSKAPTSKEVCVILDNKEQGPPNADDDIYRAKHLLPEAKRIHGLYPLFDGHNDLPWALRAGFENRLDTVDLRQDLRGQKFGKIRHQCLHTDIPRLREGGVGAQFWSVYVPVSVEGADAVQTTLEQIDVVHRLCEQYPETLEFAETAADVRRIFSDGKIACVCGAEGGHQINNSLACLRMFHRLGVRYLTLTHNGGPGWADPAIEKDGTFAEARLGGLTPFGYEVVKEMNRMGMVVDISHVHDVTMRAVLACTLAPVIFSHSSSKALCSHPRDVPDDVLESLKVNGGVIMINVSTNFVAGPFWVRGGMVGATLIEVADHIDHVKAVAGVDHIGLGADYDGILHPARGMEDVSTYPMLSAELLHRGYTGEEIGKILGLNVIRVLEAVEEVSRGLKSTSLASNVHRSDVDSDVAPAAAAPE